MKIVSYIFIALVFTNLNCASLRRNIVEKSLVNSKLDFYYGWVGAEFDIEENIHQSGKYQVFLNLSSGQLKYLNSLSDSMFLEKLNAEKTDYAFNLILYSFSSRDASMLKGTSISEWKDIDKKEEINYWREYFERKE